MAHLLADHSFVSVKCCLDASWSGMESTNNVLRCVTSVTVAAPWSLSLLSMFCTIYLLKQHEWPSTNPTIINPIFEIKMKLAASHEYLISMKGWLLVLFNQWYKNVSPTHCGPASKEVEIRCHLPANGFTWLQVNNISNWILEWSVIKWAWFPENGPISQKRQKFHANCRWSWNWKCLTPDAVPRKLAK